jgi:methionyl-tRNA formyltransferase
MDKGIDTGDVLLQRELPIGPEERLTSLHDRMAALGGECILEALERLENGTAAFTPQNHEASTYAPMIAKEDGRIDWHASAEQIVNLTRALDPWPGAYTVLSNQTLKIWTVEKAAVDCNFIYESQTAPLNTAVNKGGIAQQASGQSGTADNPPDCAPAPSLKEITSIPPGTVIASDAQRGLWVKTGGGALRITELQNPSGKRLPAADFLRGHPISVGTMFDSAPR